MLANKFGVSSILFFSCKFVDFTNHKFTGSNLKVLFFIQELLRSNLFLVVIKSYIKTTNNKKEITEIEDPKEAI
jgi:hypothetical protein